MVDRGAPVVRVLRPSAPHEVALAGGIRVPATAREFIALAGDIARWKDGPAVLQLGQFGDVPSARPTSPPCVSTNPTWRHSSAAWAGRVTSSSRLFDSEAVPDVRLEGARRHPAAPKPSSGPASDGTCGTTWPAVTRPLMVYRERRTALASEMDALLRASPSLDEQAAGAAGCTSREFPHDGRCRGRVPSPLHWARESFGLKPVLSLYHVVVIPSASEGSSVLVSKQFYASRYFDASLDVIVAVDGRRRRGRTPLSVVVQGRAIAHRLAARLHGGPQAVGRHARGRAGPREAAREVRAPRRPHRNRRGPISRWCHPDRRPRTSVIAGTREENLEVAQGTKELATEHWLEIDDLSRVVAERDGQRGTAR